MRLLFLCLFCLFLYLPSRAQERVRNVRIRVVDSTSLDIRYDLLTTRPGDSIYLQMRSRLRGSMPILPEFVRGDIGVGVTAGSDRHIYWDALANGYSLNEEVQAKVVVKTNTATVRSQPAKNEPVVTQVPTVTPAESKTVAAKPTESVVVATPKPVEPTPPAAVTVTPQPQKQSKRTKPTKPSVFAVDSVATPAPTPVPAPVAVIPAQPPTSTTVPPAQVQSTTSQSATTSVDTIPTPKVRHRYAGPAWALLSAVAPGIGNIFVQMPKPKVGLRPLVTVLCYGAVAYGLTERQKANDDYAVYEQQKNITEGDPYYKTANDHHHLYFLATRGAMVVAAADVVLTFIKGLRNSQLQKEARRIQGVTLRPGWLAGQPTAVIRYSF